MGYSVTLADFLADPRFESLGDQFDEAVISDQLVRSETYLSPRISCDPTFAVEGIKLLTAHWLVLNTPGSTLIPGMATGQVTSMSASQGSQSVSFGDPTKLMGDDRFRLTNWGADYLFLVQRGTCSVFMGFVG